MTTAVTHGSNFHADDVFAWVVLRTVFPGCQLKRTRDKDAIAQAASRMLAKAYIKAADMGAPILVLDRFCPWTETVVEEMPHVLFVVYESPDHTWMCQVVPEKLGQFAPRKPLPATWAGLRDEALAQVTGVSDTVFAHKGRFLAGARSRDGAIALANLALKEEQP